MHPEINLTRLCKSMEIAIDDIITAQAEQDRVNSRQRALDCIRSIRSCNDSSSECRLAADQAGEKLAHRLNELKDQAAALFVVTIHVGECQSKREEGMSSACLENRKSIATELERRIEEAEQLQRDLDASAPYSLEESNPMGAELGDVFTAIEAYDGD